MRPAPDAVRMVLSAQMAQGRAADGRQGPARGRPVAAASCRLPRRSRSGSLTIAGMALAFAREGLGRVALSFIGEGGSSLGEWHEAINLCAARRLPAVFCVQNNQTALSTPVARAVGRPGVRRQGRGLRHPGRHPRRHRCGRDRRGVRVGGRARPRGPRSRAHRAGVHAHVRPRAPRRHAVSRQGSAGVLGAIRQLRRRLRGRRALRVLVAPATRSPRTRRGSKPTG